MILKVSVILDLKITHFSFCKNGVYISEPYYLHLYTKISFKYKCLVQIHIQACVPLFNSVIKFDVDRHKPYFTTGFFTVYLPGQVIPTLPPSNRIKGLDH